MVKVEYRPWGKAATKPNSIEALWTCRSYAPSCCGRPTAIGSPGGIQRSAGDVLQVEHGSLYPALHRLERKGWLGSKWQSRDGNREFTYYRVCRRR